MENIQNVGTKSAFMPFFFFNLILGRGKYEPWMSHLKIEQKKRKKKKKKKKVTDQLRIRYIRHLAKKTIIF